MYNPRDPDRQRETMLSTRLPLVPVLFALSALLTGCATDNLSVNRYDLGSLNEAVASQQSDLTYLRLTGDARHQELLESSSDSTQRILNAITRQVQPPECPPVSETPVCTVAQQQQVGRDSRVNGKLVVGEVEKTYLVGPGFVYDARIDSGAETSSMDARNVRRFERDGNEWVRFDIPVPGTADDLKTIERQVARNVRIIQANEEDFERRAVVELQFRIGNHEQKAEFTLSDRAHLTYRLLIGRNILRDVMLIDVGREFSTELPRALVSESASNARSANGDN